jgi:N-methylhydantoinase A
VEGQVSSTPHDQSEGVLRGIERVCGLAADRPDAIDHVMHGTTVATNTGADRHRRTRRPRHDARLPAGAADRAQLRAGGLGGWVIYNKSLPMAPLALTIEATSA